MNRKQLNPNLFGKDYKSVCYKGFSAIDPTYQDGNKLSTNPDRTSEAWKNALNIAKMICDDKSSSVPKPQSFKNLQDRNNKPCFYYREYRKDLGSPINSIPKSEKPIDYQVTGTEVFYIKSGNQA